MWNAHYTRVATDFVYPKLFHMLIEAPTLLAAAQAWDEEYNNFPDAVLVEITRAASHIRELPDLIGEA